MTTQSSFDLVIPSWDNDSLSNYLWQSVHNQWCLNLRYILTDSEYDRAILVIEPLLE